MHNNTEQTFLDSFDCKFPYDDFSRWKSIIKQAFLTNDNAVFAVLYELVVLPARVHVDKKRLKDYILYITETNTMFTKKYSEFLLLCMNLIHGNMISESQWLRLMNRSKKFYNAYALLGIICSAVDDPTDMLDEKYKELITYWQHHPHYK